MKTLLTDLALIARRIGLPLVVGGLIVVSNSPSFAEVSQQRPSVTSRESSTRPPEVSQEHPVVINTDLVTVNVSVTDREGRHISGLDRRAFTVYDDKLTQQIKFFSDADTPISLAVIFDTSSSMRGDKVMRARDALAQFIETSHREDEYFLISFSDRAQLLFDRTRDADAMLAKFTYVRPRGETALYDATYLAYRPEDLTRKRRWHRIKVEVKSEDSSRLLVRTREGAFAPN